MRIFSPRLLTPTLLLLTLGACSLAPDYKVPPVATPTTFKEVGNWTPAQPSDDTSRGDWWTIFNDPQLNTLEDEVIKANQNLKVAVAQYDQARAALGVANADYYPTLTATPSAVREQTSANTPQKSSPVYSYNYILGANLTYEVDLWGRVRNEVSSAESLANASNADRANVELSLEATFAADYFTLRGQDAMQDVLDKTVKVDTDALQLIRNRFEGGIASEADLDQAQILLGNAQTAAADIRLQRAQLEHAMAVLAGKAPADFSIAHNPLKDETPPPISPSLPSQLLERRPDIAAAERRVAAANANIGVARAAWFPTINLTGSVGYNSSQPSNFFDAPSLFWALGPEAVLTLFDAGRIESLSDEAHAAYDETVASYRQTVLSAYQEVEDNLIALHQLDDEDKSQTTTTAAAERALVQEKHLYEGGDATYLDVAVVENTTLQAELASLNIKVRRLTAGVQLFKALGGGFKIPPTNP